MNSVPDISFRIRGRNILDLHIEGGQTVRQYLAGLLHGTLNQPGGKYLAAPVHKVLIEYGMIRRTDDALAMKLLSEAIEVLAAEPFRPVGVKTGTAQRLARLQRRSSPGRKT